jgi:hypothetical protein
MSPKTQRTFAGLALSTPLTYRLPHDPDWSRNSDLQMRIALEPDSSFPNTAHKKGPVTLARRLTLLDATLIVVGFSDHICLASKPLSSAASLSF